MALKTRMVDRLRAFRDDRRGSILVETLLTMFVIATLAIGSAEFGRYILLNQKLDRVAASVGDLISQSESLHETDVTNMFESAQHVMKPFDLGTNGIVIVSSISTVGTNPPKINWQRTGGGTLSATSRFGQEGEDATLPSGFTVVAGDSIIVAEVVYDYVPWPAEGVTNPSELYHRALFRPRFGALSTIWP